MRKTFATALILLCSLAANALPLVWRADWPDAKPVETLVHRGTDVELQPLWRINKEPADTNGWTFTTFCQTNAVGPWFGPLPGAFFSHTNDVGAAFYNVMVRAQTPGGAVNYTAFARLRMLDSPGFEPGELPLPVATIDFSKVVALNAPWLLPGATNDIGAIKVELGSISNSVSTLSAAAATNSAAIATLKDTTATNSADIATINSKIPSAASASNQLADKQWIDDEIDTYAAYYITYTAAGAAFPTRAALLNATVVYSGGVARTPTRNDYAVVLADEAHDGAEWRYIYTVAAGATSGQWDAQYPIETNDYDGLSNKPQINGVSLSGNKTGAQLDLQDALTAQQIANIAAVPYKANNFDVVHTTGDETIGGDKTFTGGNTVIPFISAGQGSIQIGISGRISQKTAAGLFDDAVVPNYGEVKSAINSAISPTDSAFSNAVLSVGLGIDTNTVAVINELVDSAHDLPVTGATSVGALKKRLSYALGTPIVIDTASSEVVEGETIYYGAATLANRTANIVQVTAATPLDELRITFPAATSGKVRDFGLRVEIGTGSAALAAPALVPIAPTGETIKIENNAAEIPALADGTATAKGVTLLYFSETATGVFVVKGEQVEEVA